MKKIAYLFPGQGAQEVGMGKDFYETFAEAKAVYQEAEDILDRPLTPWIFGGPTEELVKTVNCQVALFVTSLALLAVVQKQFPSLKPKIVCGLSLGEYTALVASNRFLFPEALRLVERRGRAMSEACEATRGTMAAILGLSPSDVEATVAAVHRPNELWVANYNTPLQTVISGTPGAIELAIQKMIERGAKRAIPLAVHGAFHSGLMQSAEEEILEAILQIPLQESDIDVAMNATGVIESTSKDILKALSHQITSSVHWFQSIQACEEQGVELYIEMGPGKVLSGMNRQIGIKGQSANIAKVADLENIAKIL